MAPSDPPEPSGSVSHDLPDLVPVRMVNEFVYCPRLFYLEWVQARFDDNPDTVQGRYQHRSVDRATGRMGEASAEDPVRQARAVLLSSERLGLIAKADVVEGHGGRVVPVEVKRGSPAPDGAAWPPEVAQLCAIGLVLRDNGYACTEGQIFFAETRERVTIAFDEELVSKTLGLLEGVRSVASAPDPPPPLVDSPKCPRCSLVGICLPDETNLHTGRSGRPPRRLTPRDSAARPLYVTEQGAVVGVRDGRVTVAKGGEVLEAARMIDVSHVSVYGNVSLTPHLMRACFANEVAISWFSYGGWFQGIAEGLPSKHVELRRRQVAIAAQAGLPAARSMVAGKIQNSRTLLRRNSRSDIGSAYGQLKALALQARDAQSIESLLGIEGTAARIYFSRFAGMLRNDDLGTFDFDGRNRRPPRDAVNCLLSFAYALLVKDLTATAMAVGFDPYLGFYHRPRFGRPALALDLAEEFRPLVADSVVVNAINNGEVRAGNFTVRAGGFALTQDARRSFIAAYERRMGHEVTHPTYGYRITYRRVMEVQARMLGAYLLGEIPDYVPFTTR